MIYVVVFLFVSVLVIIYVVGDMYYDIELLSARIRAEQSDHNKLLCNVSRLLSRSRVANDGRLIVPRKVYDNFMEQSFNNEVEDDD